MAEHNIYAYNGTRMPTNISTQSGFCVPCNAYRLPKQKSSALRMAVARYGPFAAGLLGVFVGYRLGAPTRTMRAYSEEYSDD